MNIYYLNEHINADSAFNDQRRFYNFESRSEILNNIFINNIQQIAELDQNFTIREVIVIQNSGKGVKVYFRTEVREAMYYRVCPETLKLHLIPNHFLGEETCSRFINKNLEKEIRVNILGCRKGQFKKIANSAPNRNYLTAMVRNAKLTFWPESDSDNFNNKLKRLSRYLVVVSEKLYYGRVADTRITKFAEGVKMTVSNLPYSTKNWGIEILMSFDGPERLTGKSKNTYSNVKFKLKSARDVEIVIYGYFCTAWGLRITEIDESSFMNIYFRDNIKGFLEFKKLTKYLEAILLEPFIYKCRLLGKYADIVGARAEQECDFELYGIGSNYFLNIVL